MKTCFALSICALLASTNLCQGAPAVLPMPTVPLQPQQVVRSGHYLSQEIAFELPDLITDPFDYLATDVQVQLRAGGRAYSVPAFFDGGTQWRARFTPLSPYLRWGDITLNGQKIETARQVGGISVNGEKTPLPQTQKEAFGKGFVRIDPNAPTHFVYDNGARYFPLGHNVAWTSKDVPDIPNVLSKMSAHGENWARVWMNHWDGKNLDWPLKGNLGDLNLEAARKWDAIVQRAGRNDMAIQMTLQHHGQYSTTTNPNWDDNPYNTKNGGFLDKPEEFFTNERAKALTKRKLRYAIARWGYSPSILAWELFNEVQFTDAAKAKMWPEIANWHSEMAAFLRAQDPFHHLITTSSSGELTPEVWKNMDFIQEHSYPSDLIVALGKPEGKEWTKPFFVGEFGPPNLQDPTGKYLHQGLWAGLMSGNSGAAQYWDWEAVEKYDLYSHFVGASQFLRASQLANQNDLQTLQPEVTTKERGELSFGPGAGWGEAKQNEFVVEPNGAPLGIDTLPKFLQGQNHRAMNPQPLRFKVNFTQPGRFTVQLTQIAKAGAQLKLSVGDKVIERDFPATENDSTLKGDKAVLAIEVPTGPQVVTLENSGPDWAVIERFSLSDYAPALAARALGNTQFWAAWLTANGERDDETGAATGNITVQGLKPGKYRATWMSTVKGQTLHTENLQITDKNTVKLSTSPVQSDVVIFVVPAQA